MGNNQINQLLCILSWETHSRAIKKNAEAEPEKKPIKAQIKIHLSESDIAFFKFIGLCCGIAFERNKSSFRFLIAFIALEKIFFRN